MAKYVYDVDDEVFRRLDNSGRPLNVNVTEAERIVSLMNLGYGDTAISKKVTLVKGKSSTVKSFIKNYKLGNIEIPDDAPAPTYMVEEISDGSRISALEERVTKLELMMNKSPMDKVREWLG